MPSSLPFIFYVRGMIYPNSHACSSKTHHESTIHNFKIWTLCMEHKKNSTPPFQQNDSNLFFFILEKKVIYLFIVLLNDTVNILELNIITKSF